ncbi:MAG: hypothetical protein Q7S83_01975 [bacterium]|nr:hypothetical protein [bacterium]
MREIVSPIGNPDRKWVFVDNFYLSIRGSGLDSSLFSTRTKDKYWIGHTDVYFLDDSQGKLNDDNMVVCHAFKVFGKELAMQNWGFFSELESSGGQQAVCLGGRWFLMEKGDELEMNSREKVAPFKEITLAIHNKDGIMAQAFKRPPG